MSGQNQHLCNLYMLWCIGGIAGYNQGGTIENCHVTCTVTIGTTTANAETDYVDFVGMYSPTVIYESGDEKHNLYLGSGNNIYYPSREGYTVKSCRAYFQMKNGLTAGEPTSSEAPVRAFVLNFGEGEETGIRESNLPPGGSQSPVWRGASGYTLDGMKLSGKPATKGVYIYNGRKVVIK